MKAEIIEKKIITDFPYEYETTENIWIPLAGGTRLSARTWIPKCQDPVPAILEYIPYRKTDGTRTRDEPMHQYFAGNGFAVIRVDMRGSGESDGLLKDEYLKQEQDDALEVIDWISQQPWCDGNVGMMGKSWGGFNSLQVAARRPSALRAIITVGFTDDRYNQDIHYKGGCLLNDNFWWGSIMLAYQCRPVDPHIVGDRWRDMWMERLENMPLWMKLWMDHPVKDDYWKHGSVSENYSDIQVPVMALDGWQDAYTNPVLTLMEGLSVPRKAYIGPWAHVYAHDGAPAPAINFLGEAVKWWNRWLKHEKNDIMDGPMVNVWMEDSMKPEAIHSVSRGRWVGLEGWPSKAVHNETLGLGYGKLFKLDEREIRKPEHVILKTPQGHGLLAGEWMGAGVPGETAPDQNLDDGLAMTFTSDVLDEDLEILGYPKVKIRLLSDKPKALLFAQICDIDEEGSATRVSYGIMNLTHLNGHDHVALLEPGEEVEAYVNLDVCGHHFPKGHRIRLALATTYWPMFWNMPEEAALTLKLETAELLLPVFTGEDTKGPDMNPECAPLTPLTLLSEGHVDRSISYDVLTDTWTCITDGVGGVFGEGVYRFDDIDVTVEHNLKRIQTITNGDPLSAKYTIEQQMRLGREGWWTDTTIVTTMTADLDNFYLTAKMDVMENEKPVFQKEWNETVKRVGL